MAKKIQNKRYLVNRAVYKAVKSTIISSLRTFAPIFIKVDGRMERLL